jgi:GAF domain-containing protein
MFSAIGIKAIICCPLLRAGRLRAMMAVHQTTPRHWTAHEIALVEAVVERSWAYFERARALRALADSERNLRQLADATA